MLSPSEVERMTRRFGELVLQMGHLQPDGSLAVPIDCVVEAVRSLGNQRLGEAIETLKDEHVAPMLESVATLIERVAAARRRKLERLVEQFQDEPDTAQAHCLWLDIEKMAFGVRLPD